MAYEDANRGYRDRDRRFGFTLIEVLTALAIMSVATSIFVKLFISGVGLADSSRAQRVAAQLAEERLTHVLAYPNLYTWSAPGEEQHVPGAFQGEEALIVALAEEGTLNQGEPPHDDAMPTDMGSKRAFLREKNLYEGFIWYAYAIADTQGTPYFRLIIEIKWDQSGRPKRFTLSSSIPRSDVEAVAS